MSKIKIVFYLVLVFIIYKGYVAFKDFEIGVGDRYAEIEERAEFEKEGEVVGLMISLILHPILPQGILVLEPL